LDEDAELVVEGLEEPPAVVTVKNCAPLEEELQRIVIFVDIEFALIDDINLADQ
jgi:hypothetical protein